MKEILQHLKGDEQYRFLQKLLEGIVNPNRLPVVIQKIMDDINI